MAVNYALVNVKGSARVYSWPGLLTFARIGRSPRPRWNVSGIEVHGEVELIKECIADKKDIKSNKYFNITQE